MDDEITLKRRECNRCEHEWFPKGHEDPVRCPSCGSPYWNRPKQRHVKKKARE